MGQASPVAADFEQPNGAVVAYPQDRFNSSWYGRIEYLQWGEQLNSGQSAENNSGVLYALGWTRYFDPERVRFEFFDGGTPGQALR